MTTADAIVFLVLGLIPLGLTATMFVTKERMLGFPCTIFWAIFGGYAYTQSTIPWGDIYYYLAFGSLLGMTTFTALAAFALREKRDSLADESMEKGEGKYIDESKKEDNPWGDEEGKPSKRTKGVRERADQRRERH